MKNSRHITVNGSKQLVNICLFGELAESIYGNMFFNHETFLSFIFYL